MIETIIRAMVVSVDGIRKSIGQFSGIREFLDETYGTITIEPYIHLQKRLSMDPRVTLGLAYLGNRNDRIPLLSDGTRRFEELMDTVQTSDYSHRDSTLEEDIKFMAECRERYIRKFYGRGVIITPTTKNF